MSEQLQTIVRDFYIIKVLDRATEKRIGQLLWGFVLDDDTQRFQSDDYVCTSLIEMISGNVITTAKGSQYKAIGNGKEFTAYFDEVDMFRRGYNPVQVNRLR